MKPTTRFTHLGLYLNSLLDHGRQLSINETRAHIENGTIFEWLKGEFGNEIDFSLYTTKDREVMLELFQSLANAIDAKRKMGVENNGLNLLLAYCLEGVQELDKPV